MVASSNMQLETANERLMFLIILTFMLTPEFRFFTQLFLKNSSLSASLEGQLGRVTSSYFMAKKESSSSFKSLVAASLFNPERFSLYRT